MYAITNRQPAHALILVLRRILIHAAICGLLVTFVSLTGSQAHAQFSSTGEPVTGFEIPNDAVNPAGNVSADLVPNNAPASASEATFGTPRSSGVGSASKRLFDVLKSGGILMIPILLCSFVLVVFIFERMISLRKARVIPGPFSTRFLDQLENLSLIHI